MPGWSPIEVPRSQTKSEVLFYDSLRIRLDRTGTEGRIGPQSGSPGVRQCQKFFLTTVPEEERPAKVMWLNFGLLG